MRPIFVLGLATAVVSVLVVANISFAEELKCDGAITKIEGDKLTVKGPSAEQQMKIEPATKIIIRGKPGSPMDLKVGQQVKCLCDKQGENVVCTTLEVMRDQNG